MLVKSGNKFLSMDFLASNMFIFCELFNLVKAFHISVIHIAVLALKLTILELTRFPFVSILYTTPW